MFWIRPARKEDLFSGLYFSNLTTKGEKMSPKKEKILLKVFDSHIHLGFCEENIIKRKNNLFISLEEVISYLNQNGIQKALVFPFPNLKTSSFKTNKYIAQCVEREKRRLYGLFYFSWDENFKKLSEISGSRIVGVKIHPSFSKRILTELPEAFLKIVRDNGWVLLVDSSISSIGHPMHIVEFAKKNRDITIICAHMARIFHKEILEIAKLNNVYLDLSGICLLSVDSYRLASPDFRHASLKDRDDLSPQNILEYLLHFVGNKKIVWGSDFPFTQLFGSGLNSEIDFIFKDASSFLSRETYRNILNDNIESLLVKK